MTRFQAVTEQARNAMVDALRDRRVIHTPVVERAFRGVRRHKFLLPPYAVAADPVSEEFAYTSDPCRVYADAGVALKPGSPICCPPPSVVARQIEELAPAEGMRILHVETAGGYSTALLAEIVGDRGSVVAMSYDEELAHLASVFLAQEGYTNVTVRSGDGAAGLPEVAPFDRIFVGAGAADIAPAWIEQLGEDGRLVLPLCHLGPFGPRISGGVMLSVEKTADKLVGSMTAVAVCVPLQGAMAPTPEESGALAEGLQRWFALEEFYRTDLPICIAMKPDRVPNPAAVPWFMETRNAVMWVEPH